MPRKISNKRIIVYDPDDSDTDELSEVDVSDDGPNKLEELTKLVDSMKKDMAKLRRELNKLKKK